MSEDTTTAAVVRFGGEEFRVRARVSLPALMRFAHAAKATTTTELDQWDAIYRLCAAALDPAEDLDHFLDVADRENADEKTLMLFVRKVMMGQTDRPTGRPSDSSDGPTVTAPNSEPVQDSSESPDLHVRVVRREEAAGRPDRALMVLMAHEAASAA